jgi:hypothetical protein
VLPFDLTDLKKFAKHPFIVLQLSTVEIDLMVSESQSLLRSLAVQEEAEEQRSGVLKPAIRC